MFAESIKTNLPTELLRTLVTVCEFRSVTKAAQLLQLTQPAVLQQIKSWKSSSAAKSSTGNWRA